MSDDFENEECIDNVLKDFINIKNIGAPCKVTEARKFYVKMINEIKEKIVTSLGYYLTQIGQNIPYSRIKNKDLDIISDDGEFMIENIVVFNGLLPLVYDLYKHPSAYNAWKGKLKMKIEDEEKEDEAYFVELKSIEEKIKEMGGIYI
jgi:hypothetical protein